MNYIVRSNFTIWVMIVFTSFISCNQIYKAGNLVDLRYPIETSLKSEVIKMYIDTLIRKGVYSVPQKWMHYDKLVDLDSTNNKIVYFKNNPEEMYLLSFGGMFTLSDVFNPQIKQGDWVAERSFMPKGQEVRVKQRLKKELIDVIEIMAKRDGLTDDDIYKK